MKTEGKTYLDLFQGVSETYLRNRPMMFMGPHVECHFDTYDYWESINMDHHCVLSPKISKVSKILKQSEESVFNYLMNTDDSFKMVNSYNQEESYADYYLTKFSVEKLKDKNRSLLQNWFDNCVAFFSRLSGEEIKAFDDFVNKFSKKVKQVDSWNDIDLLKIDEAFLNEVYENLDTDIFSMVRCSSEQRILDDVRSSALYHKIRKTPRSGLFRHIFLRYAIEVFLTHRYHIFSSEDSDSSYLVLQ